MTLHCIYSAICSSPSCILLKFDFSFRLLSLLCCHWVADSLTHTSHLFLFIVWSIVKVKDHQIVQNTSYKIRYTIYKKKGHDCMKRKILRTKIQGKLISSLYTSVKDVVFVKGFYLLASVSCFTKSTLNSLNEHTFKSIFH